MSQQVFNKHKQIYLLTALSGIVIVPAILINHRVVAMPQQQIQSVSQAQPAPTSPILNPRPRIFDEPPYNRSQSPTPLAPDAVTPLPAQPTPTPGSVTSPPLPEQQQAPSATVTPVNGRISLRLTNPTNATIFYQVIGDTEQRNLAGKSEVTLQNLAIPVTLTFSRQDRGLLRPTTTATSMGLLEVTFDATTDLAEDRTTLRVQPDGVVLLN